jgi:hypothetical protein
VTVIRESRAVDVARNHTAAQNGDAQNGDAQNADDRADTSDAHSLLDGTPASKHVA